MRREKKTYITKFPFPFFAQIPGAKAPKENKTAAPLAP
jgi:hypothetical protein